jgi:hypothetical protein
MFVTDHFVFLHLHKTAGTSFNAFIENFFPGNLRLGYHLPLRVLPPEWSHLPTLGLVRNPWDFYISWYSFQMQKERSNPLFNVVSDNRSLDFNCTIRRLLSLCDNRSLLSNVVAKLPKAFGGSGMNVPADAMASIFGTQLGLYSFLYQWMYAGTGRLPTVIRTDNLVINLENFFENIQVNFTSDMRSNLLTGDAQNKSNHQHYSNYYDTDVMELVNLRDELVIKLHDYKFEKFAQ